MFEGFDISFECVTLLVLMTLIHFTEVLLIVNK